MTTSEQSAAVLAAVVIKPLPLTVIQAIDMQSGLNFAATQYDLIAARYAFGEPLYRYYEQRAKNCRDGSQLLQALIDNKVA